MNTTERELLERCKPWLSGTGNEIAALIKDIEACLAKPVQEPVAVVEERGDYFHRRRIVPLALPSELPVGTKLYTTPQSREPMDGKVVNDICYEFTNPDGQVSRHSIIPLIRATEAHHGIVQ